MAQTLGTLLIDVKSDTTQLIQGFNRAESAVNKTTKTMSNAVKGFIAAYAGMSAIDAGKEFVRLSDAAKNIDSRLKLVTKSTQELSKAQSELFKISQNASIEFESTVDLYSRMARSTRDLNVSQEDLLKVTDTISKALVVSGGESASMNAALVQLSQGFASGTLRGEELNSVIEQTPRLAEAIATGMGISLGALRDVASQGKLTSEVLIKAILSQSQVLNEESAQIAQTAEKTEIKISNSLIRLASNIDKLIGFGNSVNDVLTTITESMDNASAYLESDGYTIIATLGKIKDNFVLLGADIKNVAELLLDSVGIMAFGALEPVTKVLYEATKALNSVGLSSDETLQSSLEFYNFAQKGLTNFKQSAVNNLQDIDNAYKQSKLTINERIELLKQENQSALENNKITEETSNKKQKLVDIEAKQIATKKDLITQLEIQKEKEKEFLTSDDWQEYYLKIGEYDNAWLIYQGENYEKWKSLAGDKLPELIDVYRKEFFSKMVEENISMIDEMTSAQISMIDYQIELIDSTNSWGNSLEGIAKSIGNVAGAYSNMSKVGLIAQKKQLKIDSDFAKAKEKFSEDSIEYVEAENKFIMETSNNKIDSQNREISSYANLAGAMSQFFKEGSEGAKILQSAQLALQMPSLLAGVMQQSHLPYPYNIAAMTATFGLGMSLMGGSSSKSSSPISATQMQEASFNEKMIELNSKPILDRLDRQIELLELIGYEGTAGKVKLQQSSMQYNTDIANFINDLTSVAQTVPIKAGAGNATRQLLDTAWANQFAKVNEELGVSVYTLSQAGDSVTFNANLFRQKGLDAFLSLYKYGLLPTLTNWQKAADEIGTANKDMIDQYSNAQVFEQISNLQGVMSDYIQSVYDVADGMYDARDSFKEFFDTLTGTDFYKTSDTLKAFNDVAIITQGRDLPSYLMDIIESINIVQREFGTSISEIFMSTEVNDFIGQSEELTRLIGLMGNAYTDGAESAINFIDSITTVTETLSNSADNIKSFLDSFKSEENILVDLASKVGIKIASTLDELTTQFNTLSSDLIGLTDDELNYLTSAKDYILKTNEDIIQTQIDGNEELLSTIQKNLGIIESLSSNLNSTIDKLRENSNNTDSYTLNQFEKAMNSVNQLIGSNDYEALSSAVQSAIGYSSALTDSANFANSRDMRFAQKVAANQFEQIGVTLDSEYDILKQIEENTANTVKGLEAQIKVLSQTLSGSLQELIGAVGISEYNNDVSYIEGLYAKAGQTIDQAGLSYWMNDLASGQSYSDILNSFKNLFPQASFAVGTTSVPQDMIAQIHRGEIITPKTYSDGLRNGELFMGDLSSITNSLGMIGDSILDKLDTLISSNDFYLRDIENNTRESRFV